MYKVLFLHYLTTISSLLHIFDPHSGPSATETVESGLNPGRVKLTTIKLDLQLPCMTLSTERDSVKPLLCVTDRWAGGSLTRRPNSLFFCFLV